MSDDYLEDVTGGDLLDLWKAGNTDILPVARFYADLTNDVHGFSGSDTDRYGPCHKNWSALCESLEQALYTTAKHLDESREGLNRAIDAYTETDEGNSNELGKEFDKMLNDGRLVDESDIPDKDDEPADMDTPRGSDEPNGVMRPRISGDRNVAPSRTSGDLLKGLN